MAPLPATGTVVAIYAAYEAREDEERAYLGASVIGAPCERQLWYGFRWAHEPQKFSGRMRRLFDTGHREEARMIEDLRLVGIRVKDQDESGGQFRFMAIGRHFSGHCDGVGLGFVEAPSTWHLVEAKTHSLKSMRKLKAHGLKDAHPKHYWQCVVYMGQFGLTRAFYIAHCKAVEEQDKWLDKQEELYSLRLNFDAFDYDVVMAKAERIIRAARPLTKLHGDPAAKMAFECRSCPAKGVCHDGDFARRNCRTCLHSTPIVDDSDAARWRCERLDRDLSVEDQRKGCPGHRYIPDLVPGEQIDAAEDGSWIGYRLKTGTTFIDCDARASA